MSLQPTRAEQDLPHVQAFGVALKNLHMRSAMRSRLSARLMKSHLAPCFKNPHTCKTQRGFQWISDISEKVPFFFASICFVNLQEGTKDEQGTISEAFLWPSQSALKRVTPSINSSTWCELKGKAKTTTAKRGN
jgi:hypothetical protein